MYFDGSQLRDARLALHMSQARAAERLEVCTATYQRWESGKVKPHPYNMGIIQAKFAEGFRLLDEAKKKDAKQAAEAELQAAQAALLDEEAALQSVVLTSISPPSFSVPLADLLPENMGEICDESEVPIAEPLTAQLLALVFE